MQKLVLRISQLVSLAVLLNGLSVVAMEVPQAIHDVTKNAVAPFIPQVQAVSQKITDRVPGAIEEGKVLVGKIAEAVNTEMQKIEAPQTKKLAIEPIALSGTQPVKVGKCCTSNSFTHCWNDLVKNAGAKKAELITYLTGVKARGWHGWSTNEKVAIVAAGTAVVAAVSYAVYKMCKSNNTDKKTDRK